MRPLIAIALLLSIACREDSANSAPELTGGDPDRGRGAIRRYGCGTCHTIPGIPGARAMVGPSLEGLYERTYLAGHLTNNATNLIDWIRHPQKIDPKTAMPEMAVTERDARDIAAYLYTLR